MKIRTQLRKTLYRSFAPLLLLLLAFHAIAGQEGRLVHETVYGKSLEHNVTGDDADRKVSIYLPPSYDTAPNRRYPVLYLLHGIGDTDAEFTVAWKNQNPEWGTLQALMNHGIAEGKLHELIVVMPDERTKMMGSFYTNSSATGNWEDFTTSELVRYVDQKFRTLNTAESRGLAGHSMGGYGAIKLGMKHPNVFSVVYAMNPALLGWAADVSLENPAFLTLASAKTTEDLYKGGFYSVGGMCVAQAFSPNPDRPPFFADLPFKIVDGKLQPAEPAYSKWSANMPLNMADENKQNLMKLRGLRFDTGWQDEFTHIPITARAFARKLDELGIKFGFEEYNGDHRNRMWGKDGRLYTEVLPYLSALLETESKTERTMARERQTTALAH
jgi:S-formylglutathione hydrolase FrmB